MEFDTKIKIVLRNDLKAWQELNVTAFLMSGAASVPPTSGLVSRRYGAARLGTLFGLVFVAHQLGSFFSAWLGGVCVSATGGYTLIWCAGAGLSLLAGAVSFCVDSTPRRDL